MRRTPYPLAIPPVNRGTGDASGIWWDRRAEAVAFVWETDMSMSVYPTRRSQQQLARNITTHLTDRPHVWARMTVRGHPALVAEQRGRYSPASLSFIERGLDISLVSHDHRLIDLARFAEGIRYEP
jgi:hypothetical protein